MLNTFTQPCRYPPPGHSFCETEIVLSNSTFPVAPTSTATIPLSVSLPRLCASCKWNFLSLSLPLPPPAHAHRLQTWILPWRGHPLTFFLPFSLWGKGLCFSISPTLFHFFFFVNFFFVTGVIFWFLYPGMNIGVQSTIIKKELTPTYISGLTESSSLSPVKVLTF